MFSNGLCSVDGEGPYLLFYLGKYKAKVGREGERHVVDTDRLKRWKCTL